jgi:hypothetical protein
MVTCIAVATELVLTVKVPLVAPDAREILDGTVATEVLLLVRVIVAPPEGAGPLKVTVPCEGFPPTRVEGLKVTEDTEGLLPPELALKDAIKAIQSPPAGCEKVALYDPLAFTTSSSDTSPSSVSRAVNPEPAPPVCVNRA